MADVKPNLATNEESGGWDTSSEHFGIDKKVWLEQIPVSQRQMTYLGTLIALYMAADTGQPADISNQMLNLLGFGIYHDDVAMTNLMTAGELPPRYETPTEVVYWEDMHGERLPQHIFSLKRLMNEDLVAELLEQAGDPRVSRDFTGYVPGTGDSMYTPPMVTSWGGMRDAVPEFREDLVGGPVYVAAPGTSALIRGAGSLAGASGTLAATFGEMVRQASMGGGAGIWKGALAISARFMGTKAGTVFRWIRNTAIAGSAINVATGTPMLPVAVRDAINAYEENQLVLLEEEAEAELPMGLHSLLGWTLGGARSYLDAARDAELAGETLSMAEPAPPPAIEVGQPLKQEVAPGIWNASTPVPTAEQTEVSPDDYPWVGVGNDWNPQGGPTYEYMAGTSEGMRPYERRKRYRWNAAFPDILTNPEYGFDPAYDFETIMENMTPNQLINFQGLASQAGLLNNGLDGSNPNFLAGMKDDATIFAMEQVLTLANRDGTTWEHALSKMVYARAEMQRKADSLEEDDPGYVPYTYEVYREPDWEGLAQRAKDTIRQELGREPNTWEVELLKDYMGELDREAFDADQAAGKAYHDAYGRAQDTREIQTPGSVPGVDVEGRFNAFFDEQFGNELDRKQRVETVHDKTASLMQGFDNAASIVGGR